MTTYRNNYCEWNRQHRPAEPLEDENKFSKVKLITVHRQRAVIITGDDKYRVKWEKNCSAKIHGFREDVKSVAGAWAARGLRTRVELDG